MNKGSCVIVEIYSKKDCHLCDIAKGVIKKVMREIPFDLIETDIENDPELFERYKEEIPVVFINKRREFKYFIDEKEFIRRINNSIEKDKKRQ